MRAERGFADATPEEIDRAVTSAEMAFAYTSRAPAPERATFLRAIADELIALGDELIDCANAETALPAARLVNERGRTVNQLRLFADVVEAGSWVEARIDTADPARTPPRPDNRRMLIPLGPVAVFGASNFPLAFSVAGGDTASALAAGCTVVFKAHPAHPATSELTARATATAATKTGMPAGVFALIHGVAHDVGLALVRHPLIRAVGFTGSLRAGRALMDAAAARPEPIPVYAEMGSINPVFLLPSALKAKRAAIAEGLAQSITLGVGQFCTNPGVLVGVRDSELDALRDDLGQRIDAVGEGTMLYDELSAGYRTAIERAATKGALPVTATATPADPRAARPALLTTDAAHFLEDDELRREMFGPVSLLVIAADMAELYCVAEQLEGQLTATIHGTEDELREHAALVDILKRKAGRLIFNGYPTGVEVGHAMQHGGPYPASSDARTTSVGTAAIVRFARPVCYQDFPDTALPLALRNRNDLGIWRLVDGSLTRESIA